jgi:hypothetical protein
MPEPTISQAVALSNANRDSLTTLAKGGGHTLENLRLDPEGHQSADVVHGLRAHVAGSAVGQVLVLVQHELLHRQEVRRT